MVLEVLRWLAGKLSAGLSPDMRPEEFSRAKEERIKAMGAAIITADPR